MICLLNNLRTRRTGEHKGTRAHLMTKKVKFEYEVDPNLHYTFTILMVTNKQISRIVVKHPRNCQEPSKSPVLRVNVSSKHQMATSGNL